MGDMKIIKKSGEGEIVEKKSTFIGRIIPVNEEAEATAFIDSIKKKHWDARHNCYAFVIGDNNEVTRCSDDGEPSGTAGRPILDILLKEEIHNACIVVTRYFGGVLLGTGGLVRAYQAAAKEAIEHCEMGVLTNCKRLSLTFSYNDVTRMQKFFEAHGDLIEKTTYLENVTMDVVVPVEEAKLRMEQITEESSGRVSIEDKGDCQIVI